VSGNLECRLLALTCCDGLLLEVNRQLGEDHLGQLFDGEPDFDRQRRRLDAVGALGRKQVRAEKLAARSFGNELDETACITRCERTRHLIERQHRCFYRYAPSRACASVSPTLATCGSVKTMDGIAEAS